MILYLLLLFTFSMCQLIFGKLSIIPESKGKIKTIYETSKKLRVKAKGISDSGKISDIIIGADGQSPLVKDKDFTVTIQSKSGLIFTLLPSKKWANLIGKTPPVHLMLMSIADTAGTELLAKPVVLANVIRFPSIDTNTSTIHTTSSELVIRGSGFIGVQNIDFYFNPPILKGVAYDFVSTFPCKKNEIVLILRDGYSWRDTPGPLSVKGIDTGGGRVKLNGREGVQVATVTNGQTGFRLNIGETGGGVETAQDGELELENPSFFQPGNEFMHIFFFMLPFFLFGLIACCRFISVKCFRNQ